MGIFPNKLGSFIITLFLLLTFLNNIGYSQVDGRPRIYANSNTEIIVRDKIFEQALMNAYRENPRIYEAHREALNGRSNAEHMSTMLSLDKSQYQFYRMFPDPTKIITEKGMIDWEERKKKHDIELRKSMSQNPTEVRKTASEMRAKLYGSQPAKHIRNLYEQTRDIEGDNKLPDPVNLEGLRLQYPDVAKELEREGFTEKEIEDFCSGKMNKNEFQKAMNFTSEEYNIYISNNYFIVPQAESLPQKSYEEQQRENALINHENVIAKAEASLYGGTSVLALFDPKTAGEFSRAGEAAIKMYDGIGQMIINGVVDPMNIGKVANGLSGFISLFAGINDPTAAALNAILENQKKMMLMLQEIDTKVERLQSNLSYLISLTNYNQQQIIENDIVIHERLDNIERLMSQSEYLDRVLAQQAVLRNFTLRKGSLTKRFKNDLGTKQWIERLNALWKPNSMSPGARKYFDEIDALLNEMATLATSTLVDPNDQAFVDRSNILLLEIPEIKQKEETDINQRIGMIPSVSKWLTLHIKSKDQLIDVERSDSNKYSASELDELLPNPAIISHVVSEYIDLAAYRPIQYKYDGSVAHDPNMDLFCKEIEHIEGVKKCMRLNIPLSVAILNYYFKTLKQMHEHFVIDRAKRLKLLSDSAHSGKTSIIFSGLKNDNTLRIIQNLDEVLFVELGYRMGVFEKVNKVEARESYPGTGFEDTTRIIKISSGLPTYVNLGEYTYEITHREFEQQRTKIISYDKKETMWGKMDRSKRKPFELFLLDEISKRQTAISVEWQEFLTKDLKELLGYIYKAKFCLKTLLEGGYGSMYSYIPELDTITKTIEYADSICLFIENDWKKGKNVFESGTTEILYDYKSTNLGNKHYNYIYKDTTSVTPFPMYFQKFAKFVELPDSTNKSFKFKSIIPVYNIPTKIKNPLVRDYSQVAKVLDALKWAAQFEDISPSKECLLSIENSRF